MSRAAKVDAAILLRANVVKVARAGRGAPVSLANVLAPCAPAQAARNAVRDRSK